MFSFKELPIPESASAAFSAYASIATTAMLVRSMANELIPQQLLSFLSSIFVYIFGSFSSQTKFIIEEQPSLIPNQIFDAAEIYLRTKITPSTDVLKVSKTPNDMNITLSISNDQEIADRFDNIPLQWRLVSTKDESNGQENRHFELEFPKKFRNKVVDLYLPHVVKTAEEISKEDKVIEISSCRSQSIKLNHPATFHTLAMDPELKQWIIDDSEGREGLEERVFVVWSSGYWKVELDCCHG